MQGSNPGRFFTAWTTREPYYLSKFQLYNSVLSSSHHVLQYSLMLNIFFKNRKISNTQKSRENNTINPIYSSPRFNNYQDFATFALSLYFVSPCAKMFYLKQIQENKSFYPSVLQYASLKENKAVSDTTTTLVSCPPQINNNYLVFSNTNPLLVTRRNETSDQNRGWGKAVPSTPRHAVCGRRTIRHTWILQASIQSLCLGLTGQTLPRQVGWLSLDQEIFFNIFFLFTC